MEFESADLREASFSYPSFSSDLSAGDLSRSILSRVPSSTVPVAFTPLVASSHSLSPYLSLSRVRRDRIYKRGKERGESGQIEMLYYLNSVATMVRDLLVDVAPDSPL